MKDLGRSAPAEQQTWDEVVRILYLHARGLGCSREEAEDLVHDALEVTVRDPSWYDRSRGPLTRVLRVVITNRVRDRFRSGVVRRRSRKHLELLASRPDRPDEMLVRDRASGLRRELLAALDDAEQLLFYTWMSQQRGELTGWTAADSLNITYREYEARKKRLRRRCRRILEDMGVATDDLWDLGRPSAKKADR
jgi:DNA-directed RNA polymerase specialized sigma24 family protein